MKGPEDPTAFGQPFADGVEGILADQRHRWERGEKVLVEQYLAAHPRLRDDQERLLDVIYGEILRREAVGERPQLEEYLARFPALATALRDQFAVHELMDSPEADEANQRALVDAIPTPALAEEAKVAPAERTLSRSFGPYELIGQLGQGGMGVVYKARQVTLNRIVALKTILAGPHASREQRLRFRAEAEAVARLQNPHIVQIYEVGEFDGIPFLALEFVSGGNLAALIERGPLPARQAAEMVERLALAVEDAHRAGVIHRDLKPANILLTTEGVPKIADFGLARLVDGNSHQTVTGDLLGTPSYMAPEQASGMRAHGKAADIYALGAIFYEGLTGRCAFKAATPLETLSQVQTRDPLPPRRLRRGLPRDLETIVLTCLRKEPERRYGSARALADDVHRWLAGRPIEARPTLFWERGWKWVRRHPARAAAVSIGLAAALALFGMRAISNERLRRERLAKEEIISQGLARLDRTFIRVGADKLLDVPHTTSYCKEILSGVEEQLASLSREPFSDDRMTLMLAEDGIGIADFYRRVGDSQRSARHARAVLTRLDRVDRSSAIPLRLAVARASRIEALLLRDQNRFDAALAAIDRALPLLRPAVNSPESSTPLRSVLADCIFVRAWVLKDLNRLDEAEQQFFESLAIHKALRELNPTSRREEARVNHFLGWLAADRARYEQAETHYREAEKIRESLAAESPKAAKLRIDLGYSYNNWAVFSRGQKSKEDAMSAALRNSEYWKAILTDFPEIPEYRSMYALSLLQLANLEINSSPEKASKRLEESINDQRTALESSPSQFDFRSRLGWAKDLLAEALLRQNKPEEAAKTALELPRLLPDDAWACRNAAAKLSRCAFLIEADRSRPESQRPTLALRYKEQAVNLLGQAIAKGLDDLDEVRASTDFLAIRTLPGYKSLVDH